MDCVPYIHPTNSRMLYTSDYYLVYFCALFLNPD